MEPIPPPSTRDGAEPTASRPLTSTTYRIGTANTLIRTSNVSNAYYNTADYATTTSRPRTSRRSTGRPTTARPRTGVSTLGAENQEIVCAVSESRGISPTVGLAFINLDTGEAVLSQISDSQTYVRTTHKLVVFNPTNLLIVSTAANPKSKLFSIIEDSAEDIGCNITLLDRRYWAETTGIEYIQHLAFAEDVESIKTAVSGNYYAVCCLAAVLKYVELGMSMTFPFRSLRIKYEPSEGSMFIDLATMHSLELVQNLQNAKSKDCLFGLLNHTLTPMGSRLLRSNILQPMTNAEYLKTRYDAVEELSTKEEMFFGVRQALKPFLDVDKILTQLILIPVQPTLKDTEQTINNVIMLKQFVNLIKPVFEALTGARCATLNNIRNLCATENFEPIQDIINIVINEDTTYVSKPLDLRNQRTYAVKSGVNGLLDVARQTYKEAMNDAYEHIGEISEEYGIDLQKKFDQNRQFYIVLDAGELEQRNLPPIFINVYRQKDKIECQTLDLIKRNQKIVNAHTEVLMMSDKSVQELVANARSHMSILFKISESVAMLDMLCSFAHAITSQDYVRPQIGDALAIQAGRHPIREKIHNAKFIPNDVYATQQRRFQIITGCNMSGKSTYIRSVALMTVMAQVGCFVPARFAVFPIVRQLFARISIDDNIEANASTFAAEMRETAFILRNIDRHSMVIIDELGRGTSTRDGLAIAFSIADALVESRALVWFATHFRDLANIMSERNGVFNFHLSVDASEEDKMEMLYRVTEGVAQEEHYGLKLAKVVPLPPDVLAHAEQVAYTLERQMKKKKKRSLAIVQGRRRKLLLDLKEKLLQARNADMGEDDLRAWLKNLQREFVVEMTGLDDEARDIEQGIERDDDDELVNRSSENNEMGHSAAEYQQTGGVDGEIGRKQVLRDNEETEHLSAVETDSQYVRDLIS